VINCTRLRPIPAKRADRGQAQYHCRQREKLNRALVLPAFNATQNMSCNDDRGLWLVFTKLGEVVVRYLRPVRSTPNGGMYIGDGSGLRTLVFTSSTWDKNKTTDPYHSLHVDMESNPFETCEPPDCQHKRPRRLYSPATTSTRAYPGTPWDS
jgi:hypothetical protein